MKNNASKTRVGAAPIVFRQCPEYITAPSAPQDDVHVRITSVVPLMVKEALKFVASHHTGTPGPMGVDDVCQELWLMLLEYDHHFDASRGEYIVFAKIRIRQHLFALRHGRRRSSMSMLPLHELDPPGNEPEPVELVLQSEHTSNAREAVREGLKALPTRTHASILRSSYGLLGTKRMSARHVAAKHKVSIWKMFRMRGAAERCLRLHPACAAV